jgi:hypothetical protein
MELHSLVGAEVCYSQFNDKRLNKRLEQIVSTLSQNPTESLPHAHKSWGQTKATYNFFDNEKVTPQKILEPHIRESKARCSEEQRVLAIQDTTKVELTAHPDTKGLGYLHQPYLRGFLVHSTLAVTTDGEPIGLIDQHRWIRKDDEYGKRSARKKKPMEEKESIRWLNSLHASHAGIDEKTTVVTIADREADIYELFAAPRPVNSEFVIRSAYNRVITDEGDKLHVAAKAAPECGTMTIDMEHSGKRKARQAQLTIRAREVSLKTPANLKGHKHAVTVNVVAVLEENPPQGGQAICWILLTTLPISSFADAQTIVYYYSRRWLVERYHYTLKSGCNVEDLQLETLERMQNAFATYCIVSWRLLWMTYYARKSPTASCEQIMQRWEWVLLYVMFNHTTNIPDQAPTMREAIRWLARLGGFLNRKGDGEPGVKVLWRGLQSFDDMKSTWQLAASVQPHLDKLMGNG